MAPQEKKFRGRRAGSEGRKLPRRISARSGFTLIELMLVVTVISILMAMAIPAFNSARKHANEASAISTMRSLTSVQILYRTRFGSFGGLPDLVGSGMIDDSLSDWIKSGYTFYAKGASTKTSWSMVAKPSEQAVTGDRWFFIDDSGVIRFKEAAEPSASDSPIN